MKLNFETITDIQNFLTKVEAKNVQVSFSTTEDKIIDLINSQYWPKAIDENYIVSVDDQQAKVNRARTILNSFVTIDVIKGKKFLDFGCGEGHVVELARQYAKMSVGFDHSQSHIADWVIWDIKHIIENMPYDVILAYDILDHLKSESARESAVKTIKTLLSPGGQLFIRTHPFTSRHAAHNYYKFNKAYAHLILSNAEMEEYGGIPVLKTLKPQHRYRELWNNNKLIILNERISKQQPEELFTSQDMLKFLTDKYWYEDKETNCNSDLLIDQLAIQFIDYKLTV